MQKEFVSYNQAIALKELGFDEPCLFAAYDGETLQSIYKQFISHLPLTPAPLKQQALRWFRENNEVSFYINMVGIEHYYFFVKKQFEIACFVSKNYKTHEEAEDACIDKLIEVVKNK